MSDLCVKEVYPATGEYVTMEDGREYRRHGPQHWEEFMGMSAEDISHRCEDQEAAYQAWKALNPDA